MKLLMLAGPGASGKTMMLEAVDAMCKQHGITSAHHLSSTRKSYAAAGLQTENDALSQVDFNMRFQDTVMADNCHDLWEKITAVARDCPSPDLFITDRSPYDYAAYYCTVFAERLSIDLIERKRAAGDEAMKSIAPSLSQLCLLTLPWPMPWSRDTESSDGWRADKTGKNFLWSSVVEAELISAQRRLEVTSELEDKKMFFGRMGRIAEEGTPEARARWALTQLFPTRHF